MTKHDVKAWIQAVLSPDLLKPEWRLRVGPADHPTTGHCYAATEAAYHLWGRKNGYSPRVARIDAETTHWWLERLDGDRLDVTAEQFDGQDLPYHLGRPTGFLTREPSKRAREILSRLSPARLAA